MQSVFITRPDDWHVHLRDGELLQHTVPGTANHFARALVMPNLKPALTTLQSINAYRQRIMASAINYPNFTPYMTLYLNDNIDPNMLYDMKKHPYILGAKLYPAGATTNSSEGVLSIRAIYPLLEIMQAQNLVLQLHGEVTNGDIFAREALFITKILTPLIRDFPKLRIVLEHISTRAAVDFVIQAPHTLAATITPQHLLYNRNHLLESGIKPHYYCLPILKRAQDQIALQRAVLNGNAKFFAGTDSAPHAQITKESACGCAGVYSAPFALAMYAQLFDDHGQINKLNAFVSKFGADFYQLPYINQTIELINQPQVIPQTLPLGCEQVVPLAAGSTLKWSIREST